MHRKKRKETQCEWPPFDRRLPCLLADVRANYQFSVVRCLGTLDCAIDLRTWCSPSSEWLIGTLVALVQFLLFFLPYIGDCDSPVARAGRGKKTCWMRILKN